MYTYHVYFAGLEAQSAHCRVQVREVAERVVAPQQAQHL
jgi:hypothetical protein